MFHGRFSIVIGSTFQIIISRFRRDGFELGGRVIYLRKSFRFGA